VVQSCDEKPRPLQHHEPRLCVRHPAGSSRARSEQVHVFVRASRSRRPDCRPAASPSPAAARLHEDNGGGMQRREEA
jgi:hypothetical protein